jgi:23S rRNA G2445 N2-methylase RlmL
MISMGRRRPRPEPLPACYATVVPGLEPIAQQEIERDLGGEVKRTAPGLVVFRVPDIDRSVLHLRTTEDVFLLAWGTDELTYRAEDLRRITRWTQREGNWDQLLRIHHAIRPKPKGKPTYRLVAQMSGTHGYRRVDARKALARGLAGKLPPSWPQVEENASVEIWLTIHESTAVCGLRLSDRAMRHRKYKVEHIAASLRPSVAAAMIRLAQIRPGQLVLDPMCGAGTILAECAAAARRFEPVIRVLGGDIDRAALRAAGGNLRHLGQKSLARWDARRLPLTDQSVDCLISNPPFGKQLASPDEVRPLYADVVMHFNRVLKPGSRAVLLVSDAAALRAAIRPVGWKAIEQVRVRVLGQPAFITAWRKPG